MAKVTSPAVQQARIKSKGIFRSLRENVCSVANYTSNAVDGMIFEQRKSLLRDRLISDAQFLDDLQRDAEEFGGLTACKQAHNDLVNLLEELKI